MDKPQSTELLFEMSDPGRRCHRLPQCDVPVGPVEKLLPASALADSPPPLPELGEIDLVRHFVNLSTRNMSIDTNFYPLGSCTMKYNPKRHERLSAINGVGNLHPLQTDESCQGMLALLWSMQNILAEIAGLDVVSLQPAAGAQGELTALLVAAAYYRDKGQKRTRVLIPDSAHGTNPASAAIAF
jgi:glycine dehydrogenase subunit 2